MMTIALASDHGGFAMKEEIKAWLRQTGRECKDFGTYTCDSCDYPVYAQKAARAVVSGECFCGLFFCGTGIGISIAANKVNGIRAAVCSDVFTARLTRQHNNANVLCIGGRVVGMDLAMAMIEEFLSCPFDGGERHRRRIDLIEEIEKGENLS